MCCRPSSQLLFCRFCEPPRAGRFCRNFVLIVLFFLFCRAGPVRGESEHLGTAPPRHCTDSPLLRYPVFTATLGINHLSSLSLLYLGRVTELGVSRPKGIRGRWYADQCISATVSLSDCPRFLDSPRMRRWVSFHVPPPSASEFRQHFPVVLRIHTLLFGLCIGRTAGRCCRNSDPDGSGAWKLTSSAHVRVGLGPILTY